MRIWILASVLAVSLSPLAPALAGNYSGDIATVREFLDADKSYSREERALAEAEFAKLKAGAGDMSLAAFQLAVAHIAALRGNGHTMLLPGVWPYQFNRTPLEYYAFAGGLFVVHAPQEMRELLGARVTAIEGRSVEELTEAFGRYFGARSGKRDEWVGFFLESPAILHAAGLAGSDDRLDVQFELANGSTITRTLPGALDPPKGEMFGFLDSSRLVTGRRSPARYGPMHRFDRLRGPTVVLLLLCACESSDDEDTTPEPAPPMPQRGELIGDAPALVASYSPDELLAAASSNEIAQLLADEVLTPECRIDVYPSLGCATGARLTAEDGGGAGCGPRRSRGSDLGLGVASNILLS